MKEKKSFRNQEIHFLVRSLNRHEEKMFLGYLNPASSVLGPVYSALLVVPV